MAARLRAIGIDVRVYDENVADWDGDEEVIGLSSIGSPYMAPIASRISKLAASGAGDVIVGGQGVKGLAQKEFKRLFGNATVNATNEADLVEITASALPPQESVSISTEMGQLNDDEFRLYFSTEVPFYLSQGCRYSCTFCGAERSHPRAAVRERYREISCVAVELTKVIQRCRTLGIHENKFYLSNLDLFQTPAKLEQFVACLQSVLSAFPDQRLRFRGLSTTNSFMSVYRTHPDLIHRFVEVGLEQVGFGIDGATPDVWRAVRKPHSKTTCLDAIAIARVDFGIQPEALMVFGHDGHDDVRSLGLAVDTVRFLSDRYGAIPRPHVAKGLVPGNDGWTSGVGWQKEFLFANPWAFQFLDFTCLPTDLTHEDPEFRAAVKGAFLEICNMPDCLTQYVLPEDIRLSKSQYEDAMAFNRGRFDI
jgi:hypothetical protein